MEKCPKCNDLIESIGSFSVCKDDNCDWQRIDKEIKLSTTGRKTKDERTRIKKEWYTERRSDSVKGFK